MKKNVVIAVLVISCVIINYQANIKIENTIIQAEANLKLSFENVRKANLLEQEAVSITLEEKRKNAILQEQLDACLKK